MFSKSRVRESTNRRSTRGCIRASIIRSFLGFIDGGGRKVGLRRSLLRNRRRGGRKRLSRGRFLDLFHIFKRHKACFSCSEVGYIQPTIVHVIFCVKDAIITGGEDKQFPN
jgi:hypothetical protein